MEPKLISEVFVDKMVAKVGNVDGQVKKLNQQDVCKLSALFISKFTGSASSHLNLSLHALTIMTTVDGRTKLYFA